MLFERIGLVDENFGYRENMYVGTSGNLIVYVSSEAPSAEMIENLGEKYDGKGKVLMPGFVNAHGHSPMSLMRGYGENLPLQSWLFDLVFPFEAHLYGKAVYWGQLLSMAESIRYGIISTSDIYFFLDDMAKAVSTSGAKANISQGVSANGFKPSENPGIKAMHESIIMFHGIEDGRILTDACIHAEYTSNEETVQAVLEEAHKYDVITHIHISETEFEVEECKKRHNGLTPVEYFNDMGAFDKRALAAHCVHVTDNDMDILKAKDVSVATNPISNLKLVSGICEADKMLKKGINLCVGTDSSTSNNSLDFFEELKTFALLGKLKAKDPAALTPQQVLYAGTRAGAIAQGRMDCGLVKEGYKADLIVVDTDVPNMQPVFNMMNNLVYSACGKDVVLTMCDGRVLYRDGEYTTIDIEKTIAETDAARKKILSMI